MSATMFDKIWDQHVVDDLGDGVQLLHVDRHLMHELSGQRGQLEIKQRGIRDAQPGAHRRLHGPRGVDRAGRQRRQRSLGRQDDRRRSATRAARRA